MKKLLRFIVLPVILLACTLMISACEKPEDKISIHTPFKTVYYVGEELNVTGGVLNYTKDGKTLQVAITKNMVTGFSSANAGTYNMVIYYEGLSLVMPYTINDAPTLTLNTTKYYKSTKIANAVPAGDAYYYLVFLSQTSVGATVSTTDYATGMLPSDIDSYPTNIMSKQFVNGKWVLTVYDQSMSIANRTTMIITVISENKLAVQLVAPNSNTLNFELNAY